MCVWILGLKGLIKFQQSTKRMQLTWKKHLDPLSLGHFQHLLPGVSLGTAKTEKGKI